MSSGSLSFPATGGYVSNKKGAANPYLPTEPWHPFANLVVVGVHWIILVKDCIKARKNALLV